MSKKFNWGIIGLGNIAESFADDLKLLPDARLFAVASRTQQKADLFAKKYNVPHAYGCYEDIVRTKDLDVIYVATPHSLHCENTIMCLSNKIPVLCEKPLAINSAEVKKMIACSKESNTFLMEAMWTRFLPSIEKLLELIKQKAIKNIQLIRADFGIKAPKDMNNRIFNIKLGGGSLLDVGIYPVFLSLLIMGVPSVVEAVASIGPSGVDENCGITLKNDKGQIASLFSSIVARTGIEAEIIGDNGRILLHSEFFRPTILSVIRQDGSIETIEPHYKGRGFTYEALEAMSCLKKGDIESEKMSHALSLQLMEILDIIRKKSGIYYPDHD
ncbi:MAG: Gfo/Idh/MocA family oxidoreductase [Bacteroidales bacterium]|nr:MAG: Gfo/Idh/MocA family oxidoreductase [Bacteroidales bacterium]